MLQTPMATRGMVSAPHHLAAQAGLAVLREGGNAIEAIIAAAATCAVVYPHMNGLGGDGFWLIHEPGKAPVSIDASGAAGTAAKAALYREQGLTEVPSAGPLAANTVAGVVSGWQAAQEISTRWGGLLPLSRLFEEAVHYARTGYGVTVGQVQAFQRRHEELAGQPGFATHYLRDGAHPPAGQLARQPGMANLLERLAQAGLDDFYRGAVGHHLGAELQKLGSPVGSGDLARHRSVRRRPLSISLGAGAVYNLPPPSQGLASLLILGLFERLGVDEAEGFSHIHALVEATKQAFVVRNAHVTDPAYMTIHSTTYLSEPLLDRMAGHISPNRALPWTGSLGQGDTAWFGAGDRDGRVVSYIQSVAAPFGSGVAVGDFGLLWHSRGTAFGLDEAGRNLLLPGRRPFHTLCPALARLRDGRVLAYGAMGGDGQPQTQAALFTRYTCFGQGLQQAVTGPRWRLECGPANGTCSLAVESSVKPGVVDALVEAGHEVTLVAPFDERMGHAGAVVRHADGRLEGAADPRSDGSVAAF